MTGVAAAGGGENLLGCSEGLRRTGEGGNAAVPHSNLALAATAQEVAGAVGAVLWRGQRQRLRSQLRGKCASARSLTESGYAA